MNAEMQITNVKCCMEYAINSLRDCLDEVRVSIPSNGVEMPQDDWWPMEDDDACVVIAV